MGESRAGFLGWGAVCAFVAVGSMRWARNASSADAAASATASERP
jgi:hypothetical protein